MTPEERKAYEQKTREYQDSLNANLVDGSGHSGKEAASFVGKTITNKAGQTFKVVGYQKQDPHLKTLWSWVVFGEWVKGEGSHPTRINDIVPATPKPARRIEYHNVCWSEKEADKGRFIVFVRGDKARQYRITAGHRAKFATMHKFDRTVYIV